MQQQLAVRFLITVWGIMLRPLAAHSQSIDKWISGEEEVPREVGIVYLAFLECEFSFEKSPSPLSVCSTLCVQVGRVLPAVSVISFWLSSPTALRVYNSMPSVSCSVTVSLFIVLLSELGCSKMTY